MGGSSENAWSNTRLQAAYMRNGNTPRSLPRFSTNKVGPSLAEQHHRDYRLIEVLQESHRSALGDKPHLANPHPGSLGDLVNRRADGYALNHLPDQTAADGVNETHARSDVVLASDPWGG